MAEQRQVDWQHYAQGPVARPAPQGMEVVPVMTTADLLREVTALAPQADELIQAAAPADFAPGTLMTKAIYDGVVAGSRKHGVFAHGVTYAGHPVCSAVANEALKIYEERDIVGHVQRVAPHFLKRLHALAAHPLVGEARGVGLIGALEIVQDKAARKPFDASAGVGARIQAAALENGLIVRWPRRIR